MIRYVTVLASVFVLDASDNTVPEITPDNVTADGDDVDVTNTPGDVKFVNAELVTVAAPEASTAVPEKALPNVVRLSAFQPVLVLSVVLR
jgi:hypothetical protein